MKRKTTAEKTLSGTVRPDRPDITPKVITTKEIPEPRGFLTSSGKKIYQDLAEHLLKHDALCKIDAYQLSIAAFELDLYEKTARTVKKPDDLKQVFENGTSNVSTELSILKFLKAEIKNSFKEIGMTSAAREKILAFTKEETTPGKPDPLAEAIAKMRRSQSANK